MTPNQLPHLHGRFLDGIAVTGVGTITIAVDIMKGGTVVLGFVGAILAILGGLDARKAKRLEVRVRKAQLALLEQKAKDAEHARTQGTDSDAA